MMLDREGLSVRFPFREELMVNPPDPSVSVMASRADVSERFMAAVPISGQHSPFARPAAGIQPGRMAVSGVRRVCGGLLVNAAVALKDRVDPGHVRPELLGNRPLTTPVAGRYRKLKHLRDRIAVNAKLLRRIPAAQTVRHNRASNPGIKFHCEHPSSPSMPFKT
jgi:hypothetical protein